MADYDKAKSDQLVEWARWVGLDGGRIRDIADQLEAAGREVDRLRDERDIAESETYARAALKVEVERYKKGCERADKAYAAQRDARAAAERQRDSLRQQLEATQRARADDLEMFRATEGDLAHNHRRADAAEAELDRSRVALRAIWPVYRAAVGWHYNRNSAAVLSEEVVRQHVASNKPDILAALKAAGLELP